MLRFNLNTAAIMVAILALDSLARAQSSDVELEWACSAVGNRGELGSGQGPTRAQAAAIALAKCQNKGGGCFVNSCADNNGNYQAKSPNPKSRVPRVFNIIPERRNIAPPLVRQQPAMAPKPYQPKEQPRSVANKPNQPKRPQLAPPRGNDPNSLSPKTECNQRPSRLPVAGNVWKNPCADRPARPKVHITGRPIFMPSGQQPAIAQKPSQNAGGQRAVSPQVRAYLDSLKNCKTLRSGVCVDSNQKWPKSGKGGKGPIYMPGQRPVGN